MQYWKCKCGSYEAWGSDSPPLCGKCSKCGGSALKDSEGNYREPLPHDFSMVSDVETDEGLKPLTRCKYCYHTKKQLEKPEKPTETCCYCRKNRPVSEMMQKTIISQNWKPKCISPLRWYCKDTKCWMDDQMAYD